MSEDVEMKDATAGDSAPAPAPTSGSASASASVPPTDAPKDSNNNDPLQDPELQDVDNEVIPDEEVDKEKKVEAEKAEKGNEEEEEEETDIPEPAPVPPPSLLRKDKCLKEFLESMDDYAPIIPDAVTDYYLAKSGFETSDRRIKRLLALATQKFVSDIASDAYQYSRIRSSSSVANAQNPQARARALAAGPSASQAGGGTSGAATKTVLTMEDLGNALSEYGVNVKRPEFYR